MEIVKPLIFVVFLIITGCASVVYKTTDFESLYGPSAPKPRQLTPDEAQLALRQHKVSFTKDIKHILDSRCVVCHGCYDAPCQLKLGSIEGIDRGGSKQLVYDFARLEAADPTRLFIDATNTAAWRKKGFHPVLNERNQTGVANLDNSVLVKLIQLKRLNPQPITGKLDADYDLAFDHPLQCSTVDEFPKYQFEHPKWGMPYAMPGLSLKEEYKLLQWLQEGAKLEPSPPMSAQATAAIQKWEHYFNASSLKQKLVFRYIYEHLFIGHMHFKGQPEHEFYRWVRSKTPSGQAIEEINTVRPYDDPGAVFYYRLQPVIETIVDKNHFVYELSDEKMQRYDTLFFETDYEVTALPSYEALIAANPFSAFSQLPLISKYQFLLDDAQYFVSGFIKGPVCRGESATSSIRDHFWVVFSQPGMIDQHKVSAALAENNQILGLPGEESDEISLFGFSKFDKYGEEYLVRKNAFYEQVLPKGQGFGLQNIWDGGGDNQNAALTIFRHFDSATVSKGFIGDTPLTGWVIDYPIFERLHYLLVAGFNVFGTAGHQLATRTYMDIVRQDAEDNFLRFMPISQRQAIYNSWYLGLDGLLTDKPLFNITHETQVKFKTTDYKEEFFEQIRQKLGKAAGISDSINHCEQASCTRKGVSSTQQSVDSQMRDLAKLKGLELKALPEMSLLRIKTNDAQGDLVYTLLVNKAYSNISRLIFQNSLRQPENDTLTVVPGFVGSYPNFFFNVEKNQLGEFVSLVRNATSEAELEQLYSQYGIRRTNPDIWQHADWFNQQHPLYRGLEAGLFDLNRYENL
ncbi:isomerase [Methylomonas lenta]|uniref:Isomerase n=1 Tax=Methylomonas lenta TaxID=980561 RepID=A0A177NLA7_9GAMM|nr:isomerase [Methylomonas lenta]